MESSRAEPLRHWIKITVDDIGGEYVSGIRVRISEEIGKTDGWKRVFIIEGAFVELDHDQAERKVRSFRHLYDDGYISTLGISAISSLGDIASAGGTSDCIYQEDPHAPSGNNPSLSRKSI